MKILSLTFHCTETFIPAWENYITKELNVMIDNLFDVEKHIFSEVHSESISEGRNYNLLLIFSNDELRTDFMEIEMKNIEERLFAKFGEEVMIFMTLLNPSKSKI